MTQMLIAGLNFTLYLFPMLGWDVFVVSVFGCLGFSPFKTQDKVGLLGELKLAEFSRRTETILYCCCG